MIDHPEFSVIIPVYNSEKTLDELFRRIDQVFNQIEKTYEIIFVEDCGQDRSWEILMEIKRRHSDKVTIVKLGKNYGQHNAIMCGFNMAHGRFIITIDDDLQVPPEEIPKLVDHQRKSGSDVVYGIYKQKMHGFSRNLGSRIIQKIFRYVFDTKGDITSFRLIRHEIIQKVQSHKQNFVFVDGLLHWYTSRITRTETSHEPRKAGRSGYTFSKLFRLSANLLFNFTTLPLRMVVYAGFFISIISFFIGTVFILRKLVYNVPVGYTSIIVTLFFMSGLLLLVMGVIGEYLSRLYSLQNDKPQYSIREKS